MKLDGLIFALATLLLSACNPLASGDGSSSVPVDFRPTVVAKTFKLIMGNNQAGDSHAELEDPLVIRISDSQGGGIAGIEVKAEVIAGGGSLAEQTLITDQFGEVSLNWTLGDAGDQSVRVLYQDLTLYFTATATDPVP